MVSLPPPPSSFMSNASASSTNAPLLPPPSDSFLNKSSSIDTSVNVTSSSTTFTIPGSNLTSTSAFTSALSRGSAFSPLSSSSPTTQITAGPGGNSSGSSFSPFTPVVRTLAPANTSSVSNVTAKNVTSAFGALNISSTATSPDESEVNSNSALGAPASPSTMSVKSGTSCGSNASASTASTPITSSSSAANQKKELCATCGQWHAANCNHIYDYSEAVDADLLCKLCKQPLVNPLDTKCKHTFCTSCLKSRLAVNALCPVDGEIINFLECQQSSNLVKSLLDKLLVVCPNRDYCEEVLLARYELEDHLRYHCRGTVVPCIHAHTGKCTFMAPRIAHTVHLQECPHQLTLNVSGTAMPPPSASGLFRALRSDKSDSLSSSTASYSDPRPAASVPDSALNYVEQGNAPIREVGGEHAITSFSCASSIQEGMPQSIKLYRGENCDLGISVVGGSDTPLNCIVIQEIYLDGVVARDGRLRPGDQILAVNGFDLRDATHAQAKRELSKLSTYCSLSVFREKVVPPRLMKSSKEEQVSVTLFKRSDKLLGIKIVGKKNKPGLYILDLVKDSIAELDGRLQKDDRILEINNQDVRNGTQDEALNIIQSSSEQVTFVISRRLRASTPDILRSGGGADSAELDCSTTRSTFTTVNRNTISQAATMRPFGGRPTGGPMVVGAGPSAGSPVQIVDVVVTKEPNESLGMSVAGGLYSQRGHTPVYVTNLIPDGVLARTKMVKKGDILLSINAVDLMGQTHDSTVRAIKKETSGRIRVILRLLEGPETSSGAGNFMPSWSYWLQLPRLCHTPQLVSLRRDAQTGSLGFSIIGGSDCCVQTETGTTLHRPQPIVVKTIVPNTPADTDGGLKCGDVILSVNDHSMAFIEHLEAVKLLKQCGPEVHLQVVSWPGTIV